MRLMDQSTPQSTNRRINGSIDERIHQLIGDLIDSPIGMAILAFYLFYNFSAPLVLPFLSFYAIPVSLSRRHTVFATPPGFSILPFLF